LQLIAAARPLTLTPQPLRSSEAAGTIERWRAERHPHNDALPSTVTPALNGITAGDPPVKPEITPGWILASFPYGLMHLACLAAFWTGVSGDALLVCLASYAIRMFGVTAGYHRYFSHRTFRTSRFFQFLLALLATASAQLGPLWWAATHRHHHASSDTEHDPHSPRHYGFFWSHMGWFLHPGNRRNNQAAIRDYARFPELVFIDRWSLISPALLGTATFLLGRVLAEAGRPTSGAQMLVWGFFISTVLLYHGTYTINSLSHVFGSQRFETGDDSRNNLLLALITLGEGWHNNHHHCQSSCRQGIYWWEIDITYLTLLVLAKLGLVWDLRPVPAKVYAQAAERRHSGRPQP
jgi:stearoyl-CoA desaturase (delta-9 desaturase)